ncbi:MAG: hypothetical protein P1V81_04755 [Planctomycetota bacterium]|nr:hypothetical protein [Planctomycetota bacterium]
MGTQSELSFERQVLDAFQILRGSLIEVFAAAELDMSKPYPAARKLEVNKNLTWKASKIIRATGPQDAIRHLPGKAGMKLLLDALERHGADASVVERTRAAVAELDTLIERHSGDKATLELMLDGMLDSDGDSEQLETSRKLAYRGNSGVWGMQVRARLTTFVMAPDKPGSDVFDNLLLTGFLGLRRLRPETPWTLLRLRAYQDDGTTIWKGSDQQGSAGVPSTAALDPKAEELFGGPLLPAFSSPHLPPLETRQEADELVIELPGVPVGKQGSVDAFFGRIDRSFASMHATPTDTHGEFLTDYTLPVQESQFDMIVHRDLPRFDEASFRIFSRLDGRLPPPSVRREKMALPINVEVRELGMGLHAMATPLYPRYTELIKDSFGRLGWDPREFYTLRVKVEYPPMATTGVFSFPLIPPGR